MKDGWLQLMGARAKALDNLKEAMGEEEVTNDMLKAHIEDMTRREAFKYLADMGFPVAPVYEAHEAMDDPHLLARGMWVEVPHSKIGKYRVPNFPAKFYSTPGSATMGAPMLGEHTEEVLVGMLGYTPERVKELEKEGKVVVWRG